MFEKAIENILNAQPIKYYPNKEDAQRVLRERNARLAGQISQLLESKGEKYLMASENELAYVAGLVDGEAYIGVQKYYGNGRVTTGYGIIFELAMTDKAVIDYVNSLLPKPKRIIIETRARLKPSYRLKLSYGSAYRFLKTIFPYLRVMRNRASMCFELEDLRRHYKSISLKHPNSNRYLPFPEEYTTKAESLCSQIKATCKKRRTDYAK